MGKYKARSYIGFCSVNLNTIKHLNTAAIRCKDFIEKTSIGWEKTDCSYGSKLCTCVCMVYWSLSFLARYPIAEEHLVVLRVLIFIFLVTIIIRHINSINIGMR